MTSVECLNNILNIVPTPQKAVSAMIWYKVLGELKVNVTCSPTLDVDEDEDDEFSQVFSTGEMKD